MTTGALVPERFGRYRVVELLGTGANGLVYRVQDPDAGVSVALKVLRAGLGQASDLKREFRLVADLTHRNLVLPYALETDGDEVFFTMELVTGETVTSWLERASDRPRDERIRDAFRQIAEGLVALHERGLLHRDIKPSNILVEPGGRVAILDFGLVRRIDGPLDTSRRYFGGTPRYLAPEVLSGAQASPASDAYALGVLFHEALTGRLPYHEEVRESVIARMLERGSPEIVGPAEDLARVCRGLLHADPARRLALPDLVAELGPSAGSGAIARVAPTSIFVERDDELGRMKRAWQHVVAHRGPMIIHLPGQSGMGKSALLRAFGRQMRDAAWILEGRAYEHDTVPFKALDAAMDQLAQRIASLPGAERRALRPSQPEALHVLFPSLAKALRIDRPEAPPPDPVARRRWGARALRELLARVSERFGVVLMLDDLQWGDLESARLLIDVLAPPGPAILVLLSYRSEIEAPFLALYKRWEVDNLASETVPVKPLPPEAAMRMAETLSGSDARAATVAKESDGCPFLIEMLLSTPGDSLSFENALGSRLDALPPAARRMLEAVCVAARPLPRGRVPFAPDCPSETRTAWAMLVRGRLLRSDGSTAADVVEAYHDRIRDAVTRALPDDDRRGAHLALGDSFAAAGDAEGAATHLAAAGKRERALGFAEAAARSALDALAFDRAAQLLALALDCARDDAAVRRDLTLRRARALANAGRGAEAAPLFLECARAGTEAEGLDLRREAMEQYLVAGRHDDGRPVMVRLLADLGVWLPRSAWLTNAALYASVGRLLLRGPKMKEQRALTDRERILLDTFGSIGKGLTACESSLGSWFFLRAARRALDWGEPKLAVRGITYLASLLGFSGVPSDVERADKWIAAGVALAKEHDDGHALAFCEVGRGMIEVCCGRWERAIQTFAAAAEVLDAQFAASDWEANLAKGALLFALVQVGHIGELEERASTFTREARERGDLALEVESNLYVSLAAIARDSVADARRCIDRNLRLWTMRGYHFQHWIALRFGAMTCLYDGSFEEALAMMDEGIPRARAANLTAMQVVRVEAHDLHGRAALGVAARAKRLRRARAIARVEEDIATLAREKRPHAQAPASMLRAGLAVLRRDRELALAHLAAAVRAYDEAAMRTHSLTAGWHVATLTRDVAAIERIENALRERGVRAPARWARMHLAVGGT
ncbi:MAG: protein kinase [Labilithrix sp.]|nr:protein kinase [Labilithrix sp.]